MVPPLQLVTLEVQPVALALEVVHPVNRGLGHSLPGVVHPVRGGQGRDLPALQLSLMALLEPLEPCCVLFAEGRGLFGLRLGALVATDLWRCRGRHTEGRRK
jgi:hypothetical protein